MSSDKPPPVFWLSLCGFADRYLVLCYALLVWCNGVMYFALAVREFGGNATAAAVAVAVDFFPGSK